ncbi:SRPBCC family protein [Nonomuraea longicatena]|uniref:SRPBCC family protein n=1 Tax=Nonomuraea longicatena TaxID=83682 RepID=A0ABN1QLP9_9ACTN
MTVSAPGARDLVVVRSFDAPRHLVFDALTRPELLVRWLGAQGWRLVECEVDLRPGGAWRFVSTGPDGQKMGHGGHYVEVVPGERLAYTESYDDQWVEGEALVTAELAESGGPPELPELPELTVLTTTIRFPSREVREAALRSPMESGLAHGYARLDEILEGLTA